MKKTHSATPRVRTRLYPLLHNTHNNIKTEMILVFVSELERLLASGPVEYTRPDLPRRTERPRRVDKSELIHVDDYFTLPCLNIDCVWTKYMSMFHRSKPLRRLPAHDEVGNCFVCERSRQGKLDLSAVRLTEDYTVLVE